MDITQNTIDGTGNSGTGNMGIGETRDVVNNNGDIGETAHDGTGTFHPELDDETLARAILTFCIDGADALLFATIKGAGSAVEALRLIIAGSQTAKARNRLDEAFATGTAKWGRSVNARGMDAFHHALDRWRSRLAQLPSRDPNELRAWITMNGSQWIIGPTSPYWPRQLDDLSIRKDWASPLCIWGIGEPQALVSCESPIAVVGSRGIDEYGRYVARTVAKKASEQGHLVVSGGAFGADAAAHWGALDTMSMLGPEESGRTVAVFAGGLNHIGPERNRKLFERIVANHGALISELCPDTIPEARRFLLRNRIIAALASTVVVAQARSRSGALNTANWAADLGREVYAAPGNINRPSNTGCNWLIRDHRASILYSVNAIEEICHAPHPPTTETTEVGKAGTTNDEAALANNADNDGSNSQENTGKQATQMTIALPRRRNTYGSANDSRQHADRTHDISHASNPDRAYTTMCRSNLATHSKSKVFKTSPPTASPPQREVLTAIRRCRRRGIPASHDAILAMLHETAPALSPVSATTSASTAPQPSDSAPTSGSASMTNNHQPSAEAWDITRLEGTLGEMELMGMVRLRSGVVSIATGSA